MILLLITSIFFLEKIFVVPSIMVNFIYWLERKEHFKSGDSNPGLVIQTNPTLVAVATDLRKSSGSYPVVKIIKVPLNNLKVGTRVVTVAHYGESINPNTSHWIDFYPINC